MGQKILGPFTGGTQTECNFEEYALTTNIAVGLGSTTDLGGSATKGQLMGVTTKDGQEVCTGVKINYKVTKKVWIPLTPGVGIAVDGYWEPHPTSSITILVSWTTYTPTPSPSPAPSDPDYTSGDPADYEETQIEEWVERQVVLQEGINEECVDTYQTTDLKQGEKAALGNIINPYIKDVATAQAIGEAAIYESLRGTHFVASIPPNLMARLGDFVQFYYSWYFLIALERLQGMDFQISGDSQRVNWEFYVRRNTE